MSKEGKTGNRTYTITQTSIDIFVTISLQKFASPGYEGKKLKTKPMQRKQEIYNLKGLGMCKPVYKLGWHT